MYEQIKAAEYEVISLYPYCPWEIGELLLVDEEGELHSKTAGYPESRFKVTETEALKMPHVFRNTLSQLQTGQKEIKSKETLPEHGIEVIGYSEQWIDEDYNRTGKRVCFHNDGNWTSAYWNNTQDCYETDNETVPTSWEPMNASQNIAHTENKELKPLSEISDEHAIEVAKLANMDVAKQEALTDKEIVNVNEFGVIEVACWEKISTERDEWDIYPFYIDTTGADFLFYDHMGSTSNPVKVIDYLRQFYRIPNKYLLPNAIDWEKMKSIKDGILELIENNSVLENKDDTFIYTINQETIEARISDFFKQHFNSEAHMGEGESLLNEVKRIRKDLDAKIEALEVEKQALNTESEEYSQKWYWKQAYLHLLPDLITRIIELEKDSPITRK